MSKPTIEQAAGRALLLLLQNDTQRALEELRQNGRFYVSMNDGEPILIDTESPNPCYTCSPEQLHRCRVERWKLRQQGKITHSCVVFARGLEAERRTGGPR